MRGWWLAWWVVGVAIALHAPPSAVSKISFVHEHEPSPDVLSRMREVRDTVPPGVDCRRVQVCTSRAICCVVCEHGSVQVGEWLENAMRVQNAASRTASMCDAQLIGTHNSGITLADGYGVEDEVWVAALSSVSPYPLPFNTNNQLLSVVDQLRLGVRHIELDVHWVFQQFVVAHCGSVHVPSLNAVVDVLNNASLAAGFGSIEWDSETIGCYPSGSSLPPDDQTLLTTALGDIHGWLLANPKEVIVVYLDNQRDVAKWNKTALLTSTVQTAFGNALFTPSVLQSQFSNSWPSLASLAARGWQVVVVSSQDLGEDMHDTMFARDSFCGWHETSPPTTDTSAISSTNSSCPPLQAHQWWRVLSSEIHYGVVNARGQYAPDLPPLDGPTATALLRCGANVVAPDMLTPDRMRGMVWSVAPENTVPLSRASCMYLRTTDARWVLDTACNATNAGNSTTAAAACLREGPEVQWRLGSARVAQDTGEIVGVCDQEGFVFGVPSSARRNEELARVAREAGVSRVWLNLAGLV